MDLVVHEVIDKEVYKEITKGVEEVNKKLVKEYNDFFFKFYLCMGKNLVGDGHGCCGGRGGQQGGQQGDGGGQQEVGQGVQ